MQSQMEHYSDLVQIHSLCGYRGLFDQALLEMHIEQNGIECHFIHNGTVRCIRRQDLYNIVNKIIHYSEVTRAKTVGDILQYTGRMLKKKEVAKILDCSVKTVDRHIAGGNLVSYKMGGSKQSGVRILGDSLDRFLNQGN